MAGPGMASALLAASLYGWDKGSVEVASSPWPSKWANPMRKARRTNIAWWLRLWDQAEHLCAARRSSVEVLRRPRAKLLPKMSWHEAETDFPFFEMARAIRRR